MRRERVVFNKLLSLVAERLPISLRLVGKYRKLITEAGNDDKDREE